MRLLSTGACALLCVALPSQSVIVPNASATTSTGLLLNNQLREGANARTYMQGIAAAELSGIPIGAVITGLSHRAGNTSQATFPAANATWSTYDIQIGPAIPLASWTTTFASNFAAPPTKVRTGVLNIEAGSIVYNPAITTPNVQAWGTFYFDLQKPFVYLGGDLAIHFTHPGSSPGTAGIFLDGVSSGGNTIAYTHSTTYNAPVATATTNFTVVRIHYGFGAGCAGGSGTAPNLVLSNNVTGGGSATFAGANGVPSAAAAFVLGTVPLSIPLPGGCSLLNDAVVAVPTTLSQYGRASLSGTFSPGVGGTILCQLFALDTALPSGFAASLSGNLTVKP